MEFRKYNDEYYQKVCNFLIELNKSDNSHINWNWARFEWMREHPWFKSELIDSIGLWFDNDRIVGVAIYDMYFGEAFVGVLKEYDYLYEEVLDYAFNNLKDESGLGIAINDNNLKEIEIAKKHGFSINEQTENMMVIDLKEKLPIKLMDGLSFYTEDKPSEIREIQWVIWQGFDHGNDRDEFEKTEAPINKTRKHLNPYLNVSIVDQMKTRVAFASVWYDPSTDYAYVEPVCVIPEYRGKGVGVALVRECLNRAGILGAKKAYVGSDNDFYRKVGFKDLYHYTFYWKRNVIEVNSIPYQIIKLLGKGKGGYSYLAERDGKQYVLKQIHHEPCDYYQFGNKIEAELHDYERLNNAGIRIPKMIDIDKDNERILKEYIDGKTIAEMINDEESVEEYIPQVEEMARLAKEAGLNIDYYPTNFIPQNGILYYVDYECNDYMEEWSFPVWGIKHWKK